MTTLILPGFTLKNRDWAEKVKLELETANVEAKVIYWPHWTTNQTESNWTTTEAEKLLHVNGPVNILAKSVGSIITMKALKNNPNFIAKLLICGLPLTDFNPGDESYFKTLKTFPPKNFLCLQNELDNHGTFMEVKNFLATINEDLTLLSKPMSDHDYPYYEDFISFFST